MRPAVWEVLNAPADRLRQRLILPSNRPGPRRIIRSNPMHPSAPSPRLALPRHRSRAPAALVGVLALCLLPPANLTVLQWRGSAFARDSIQAVSTRAAQLTSADFNGDGSFEELAFADGRVTIATESQTVWESPVAWSVSQAIVSDLNDDGVPEMTMIVWRPHAPWPIDRWLPHGGRIDTFHDAAGQSCHLILIGWKQGRWREVWAGSALSDPLVQIDAVDLDLDGAEELLALEGRYGVRQSVGSGRLGLWKWNGFGFTLEARATGDYSQYLLATSADRRLLILTQESWR
jgi:hypothetical protein